MNKKITLTNIIMLCVVLIATTIVLTACNGENEMPEPDYEYAEDNGLEEIEYEDFDEPKPAIEFSMDLAEDFLSQFISIFSLGIHIDGNFYYWDDWRRDLQYALQLSSSPLVYIELDDGRRTQDHNWYNGRAFDKYGYLIPDDAVFLHSGLIANSFAIYDLDEDGIPEILISFSALSVGFDILYRFIDGEYQAVADTFGGLRFYRDKDGSIIALTPDHGELFVTQINLLPDSTEVEHLVTISDGEPDAEFDMTSKTPVARLTWLEEEITASIKERLNIWTDLGIVRIPPGWDYIFAGDGYDLIGNHFNLSIRSIGVNNDNTILDEFDSHQPFIFDDGNVGYLLKGHEGGEGILAVLYPNPFHTSIVLKLYDITPLVANEGAIFEQLVYDIARTINNPFTQPADANWQNMGIIRIPPDWGWYEDAQGSIAVYNLDDYGNGISLVIREVSDLTDFISQFESSEPFDFYEEGWGLMLTGHLTDPFNLATWLRPDLWRALTFYNVGGFDNFTQNEELILSVVRTFGGPPVSH